MVRLSLSASAALVLAFAVPPSLAAPAEQLSGAVTPQLATPVSAEAYLARVRQPETPPASAQNPSSHRFNMTQNGRRMTAEEFEAWMRSRGIRVATGRPTPAAAPASAPAATAATPACTPTAALTC